MISNFPDNGSFGQNFCHFIAALSIIDTKTQLQVHSLSTDWENNLFDWADQGRKPLTVFAAVQNAIPIDLRKPTDDAVATHAIGRK